MVPDRLQAAFGDLASNVLSITAESPVAVPYLFSVTAIPKFCPRTKISATNSNCSSSSVYATPEFLYDWNIALSFGKSVVNRTAEEEIAMAKTLYQTPVSNLAQVIHAAVRLDIGYTLPNNFLANSSASLINATIAPVFPSTGTVSSLYQGLKDPSSAEISYPVAATSEGFIDTSFPCRYTIPKSPTQVFFAVVVATLSIFGGGWTAFMFVATFWAKSQSFGGGCFISRLAM